MKSEGEWTHFLIVDDEQQISSIFFAYLVLLSQGLQCHLRAEKMASRALGSGLYIPNRPGCRAARFLGLCPDMGWVMTYCVGDP